MFYFFLFLCYLFFFFFFFFFNDTATTEIYTSFPTRRSSDRPSRDHDRGRQHGRCPTGHRRARRDRRSEEHTSELQSQSNLVCRLLLEKKKQTRFSVALHPYTKYK